MSPEDDPDYNDASQIDWDFSETQKRKSPE
jgi:hypothetical protein